MNIRSNFKSNPEFSSKETKDGTLIIAPSSNSIYLLNETGSFLWSKGDKGSSIEDAINDMTKKFDISFDRAKKDTVDFLKTANQENPPFFIFFDTGK